MSNFYSNREMLTTRHLGVTAHSSWTGTFGLSSRVYNLTDGQRAVAIDVFTRICVNQHEK